MAHLPKSPEPSQSPDNEDMFLMVLPDETDVAWTPAEVPGQRYRAGQHRAGRLAITEGQDVEDLRPDFSLNELQVRRPEVYSNDPTDRYPEILSLADQAARELAESVGAQIKPQRWALAKRDTSPDEDTVHLPVTVDPDIEIVALSPLTPKLRPLVAASLLDPELQPLTASLADRVAQGLTDYSSGDHDVILDGIYPENFGVDANGVLFLGGYDAVIRKKGKRAGLPDAAAEQSDLTDM
ncbi:MAG TPA: hypothetical protein VF572_07000 [Candidatus Saccharimonadales bacterium]|jgi:hypothetical protein